MGGLTLLPGVYKFDAAAGLTGDLTLDAQGDEKATWVFQIGTSLSMNDNSAMRFTSDFGNADFIYWQIGSSAVIEKKANVMGNFMALQSIAVKGKAVVLGRLLARNAAVTLDDNVVTKTNSVNATNNGGSFINEADDDNTLSDGAIAGIVIGAVVVTAAAVGAVAYVVLGSAAKAGGAAAAEPAGAGL